MVLILMGWMIGDIAYLLSHSINLETSWLDVKIIPVAGTHLKTRALIEMRMVVSFHDAASAISVYRVKLVVRYALVVSMMLIVMNGTIRWMDGNG